MRISELTNPPLGTEIKPLRPLPVNYAPSTSVSNLQAKGLRGNEEMKRDLERSQLMTGPEQFMKKPGYAGQGFAANDPRRLDGAGAGRGFVNPPPVVPRPTAPKSKPVAKADVPTPTTTPPANPVFANPDYSPSAISGTSAPEQPIQSAQPAGSGGLRGQFSTKSDSEQPAYKGSGSPMAGVR